MYIVTRNSEIYHLAVPHHSHPELYVIACQSYPTWALMHHPHWLPVEEIPKGLRMCEHCAELLSQNASNDKE